METEKYYKILKEKFAIDLEKSKIISDDGQKSHIIYNNQHIEINTSSKTITIGEKDYKIIDDEIFELSGKHYVSIAKNSRDLYEKIKGTTENKCQSIYIEDNTATIISLGDIYIAVNDSKSDISDHSTIVLQNEKGESFYLMKACAIVHQNQLHTYKKVSSILTGPYTIFDDNTEPIIVSKQFKISKNMISFRKKQIKTVAKVYSAVWGRDIKNELIKITQDYPINTVKIHIKGNIIEPYWKKESVKKLFPVLNSPEKIFNSDEVYIAEIHNGIPRKLFFDNRVYRFEFSKEAVKIYKLLQAPIVEIYITSKAKITYKDGHMKQIDMGINSLGKHIVESITGKNYNFYDNTFYTDKCSGVLYPTGLIKIETRNKKCMQKFGAIGEKLTIKIDIHGKTHYMKIEKPLQINKECISNFVDDAEKIEYSEQRWDITLSNKTTINRPAKKPLVINLD